MQSAAASPRWPAPGQDIAVAAPAGAFDHLALRRGLEVLAALAPDSPVKVDDAVWSVDGYFAGDDALRAGHLQRLMAEDRPGAVICARGGFGASRLLGLMDLAACARAGTCLIGFSDITALLLALYGRGLTTVHGPVVTQLPRLDRESLGDLADLLAGRLPWPVIHQGQGLSSGRASGPLVGGNLSLLCHLIGTPHCPDLGGAVLFIEEVNEEPYRLDRLLTKLELAGVWQAVAGVAVGALSDQAEDPPRLAEVVIRRLGGLGVPVVSGLPFGHGAANRSLPMGATATVDGNTGLCTVGEDIA